MPDDVQTKIAAVWSTMDASWESCGKIPEDKATMNAGKVALITAQEQITYDQLDARVNRVGNALTAMGVQKADTSGRIGNSNGIVVLPRHTPGVCDASSAPWPPASAARSMAATPVAGAGQALPQAVG
jgi:hypothetical protein